MKTANEIEEEGAIALGEGLKTNSSLTQLDLFGVERKGLLASRFWNNRLNRQYNWS